MNNIASIVYVVEDLATAKAIHTAVLGSEPDTDSDYYVGFNVGGIEIGLTPQGAEGSRPLVSQPHPPLARSDIRTP